MRLGTSLAAPSLPSAAASPADTLSTASAEKTASAKKPAKNGGNSHSIPPAADTAEYVWPLGVVAGLPASAAAATSSPKSAAERSEVTVGSAGDHPAVQQLLSAVFQAPSRDEFSASLEDPFYEPCDRVLLKRGPQLLGHAHVASRVVRFDGDDLPASLLYRTAVLPEHRGRGHGRRLLDRVDDVMRSEGSLLGLLTTRVPHFFRRNDWVVCMRHSHASVGTRDLLAQLSARGFAPHEADDTLNIRPWRHVELPSLVRLYDDRLRRASGPLQRTEAYWRWLVGRQAAETIFVALAGPKRFDFDFHDDSIVGYVVVKDDRILELVASPRHPGTAERLLARACGDAIERDHHVVRLHLAPDDGLWPVVEEAEGLLQRGEACQGEVSMVKLLDPPAFLQRLLPKLDVRLEAAPTRGPAARSPECSGVGASVGTARSLKLPLELGLIVNQWRTRLSLSRRGVRLMNTTPGKTWLKLNPADFTRLLLGHLDLTDAETLSRIQSSSPTAVAAAAALFPQLPLWRPPLDDLLV